MEYLKAVTVQIVTDWQEIWIGRRQMMYTSLQLDRYNTPAAIKEISSLFYNITNKDDSVNIKNILSNRRVEMDDC